MTFPNTDAVIDYIKANLSVQKWVTDAREYNKELCALINGEGFADFLIQKIEYIESEQKSISRKKYARDIADMTTRLEIPIQNVFSSTGGIKNYRNGDYQMTDAEVAKLMGILSNTRDGKSLERYLEEHGVNLYHTDPAGVLYLVYTSDATGLTSAYPTYQGINAIRTYIPKGQLVENILFEPVNTKDAAGDEVITWVCVDDAWQYTIMQRGNTFTVNPDPTKTFAHPFGTCPVIINSNLTDKYGARLSPYHTILPLLREYGRDQSIKTIYKFIQGNPKSWIKRMLCVSCGGKTQKTGDDVCKSCGGTGWMLGKMDVADTAQIPISNDPDAPQIEGKDLAGFIEPAIDYLEYITGELEFLEANAFKSFWGVEQKKEVQKTATEIHYDMQPQINKLNKYADQFEWKESTFTEWIANGIDTTKPKDKSISLIVYGRRFILEGIDTILEKYEAARKAGDPTVVLDSIFQQLLIVKFKNDPEWMAQELKKAKCEPYLHQSVDDINDMFGPEEAQRKIYFQRWWSNLTDDNLKMDVIPLQEKYDADFKVYLPKVIVKQPAQVIPIPGAAPQPQPAPAATK